MSDLKILSKSEQIGQILSKAIHSGQYKAGDRFPSENELSATYKISRNTIREAVSSLVHQGLLVRIQGKGTFIHSLRAKSTDSVTTYALFVQPTGHLYENQTRTLIREFQKLGGLCLVVDISHEKLGDTAYHLDRILKDVLLKNPACLVIEGHNEFPFEVLKENEEHLPRLLFINRFDYAEPFRAQAILTDSENGGYIATGHLIKLGHKRIAYLSFRYREHAQSPAKWTEPKRTGFLEAMEGAGLTASAQVLYRSADDRETVDMIRQVLGASDRPTAIFAASDNWAKFVYDIAVEMGLRIPEDLSLVGYYDTPWSQINAVPLTTVSTQEETIAKLVVEKFKNTSGVPPDVMETVYVKPKLIVRRSTAAPSAGTV